MDEKKKKEQSIEEEILENRKDRKDRKETEEEIEVVKPKVTNRKKFSKKFDDLKIKYKKDPKKYIVMASCILLALALLGGTSYAYLSYVSKTGNTTVIEAGTLALTFANESNAITLDNAVPQQDNNALEENTEYTFSIKNNGSLAASYRITLDSTCTLDKTYSINGENVRPDKCIPDSHIKVGIKEGNGEYTVLDKTSENDYVIAAGSLNGGAEKSYTMKIWLDYDTPNDYNSHGTLNIIYSGKLGLDYEQGAANLDISGANAPKLDGNMIPVYYDETAEVWKKADGTNENPTYKWYDYDNKMWANSVTVSSTNRTTYLNASPGTEISMDDILTMQVWVPRYKYKVWNYNADGTVGSEPQEIEIVFEEGTSSTGEIECTDSISGTDGAKSESCKINNAECTDSTCNNKYYTHPAFTFGSEEIEGFWIGKFELTGTISNITTKPNISSLRNQRVGDFSTNIMAMNDEGNIYGLDTTTDTHMIKNMEWGAVAYLSHSKYGTCDNGTCHEIGINNNSNYLTGCGAEAGSSSSSTCNSYNTELGMKASTTHNIYGVYDMSGGAIDYVMGNIVSPDGTTMMSGSSTGYNSGYTGILSDGGNYTTYTGTYSYPDAKYYDKYSFGTSPSKRQRSKLGDGIKEVYNTGSDGWYSDSSSLAYSFNPWFFRGGNYGSGSNAGAFSSDYDYGFANTFSSSRLVITP